MTVFTACIGLIAMGLVFYLVERMTTPPLSPQEPPLLKPRVPLIGHIIGLFKHEADYFSILRIRTNQSAVTMPMLNSKNYVIFSPFLAQQAMRHRSLDFDLVGLAFAKSVASISEQAMAERTKKGPNTYTSDTIAAIKSSLTGEGLRGMNIAMLDYVSSRLNDIGAQEGLRVQSLWLWMRDMMTMATVEAFYGHANPFRADTAGLTALWEFDDALPAMLFMPPALAKTGARCRDRMVRTLRPYFDANSHRNDDVSAFVALRTEASIKHNVLGDDLCKGEVINIWVSTANSIPALFWTLTNVCLRPDLVVKLREEIHPYITISTENGQKKATLDIRAVEKQCSLLLSCQREGVRFANHMVARRAVTEDTVLTEENGRSYLLKQGTDVMWSAKVAHEMAEAWGTDSAEFNPDRFMRETTKEMERQQRAAYMPFGGGAHLCPGRNFAFAEILGLIGALVMGYEIQGLKAENIKMGTRALASAIPKPTDDGDGGPVTLRRRNGWEDVQWGYAC